MKSPLQVLSSLPLHLFVTPVFRLFVCSVFLFIASTTFYICLFAYCLCFVCLFVQVFSWLSLLHTLFSSFSSMSASRGHSTSTEEMLSWKWRWKHAVGSEGVLVKEATKTSSVVEREKQKLLEIKQVEEAKATQDGWWSQPGLSLLHTSSPPKGPLM